MANPSLAVPVKSPDPSLAIQYALLVADAEAVPPNQVVYNPGAVINVAYGAINVNYTVVTTFFGNDLATDLNPGRATDIVSFGFVAQDAAGNAVIAIRGTDGIFEWIQDFKFLTVKCPITPGSGLSEDGFTAVYESLRVDKATPSQTLVSALPGMAFPNPVKSLTVCGHSLGAALATLLALDIAANTQFGSQLTVLTYASPRVGDPSFADTYNQLVPNTTRIANRLDIVTQLPPPSLYKHVDSAFELNPGLKVKFDIACQHHTTTYLHLLSLLTGGAVLPLDQGCAGL